jgi:WD40 repeat protein
MSSRVFRIFLSSTFGDFEAEREELRAKVWPKLEAFCKAKGASFEVVDLRWGISEEDGTAHDTLRICLDEVAHCQRLSPKPNFLLLVGDRYGWRPLPTEIPIDEFEDIRSLYQANPEDIALLDHWYRRDDNAVPPHEKLLPKDEARLAGEKWENVEARLLNLLRGGAHRLGKNSARRTRYFLSATHLEIKRGIIEPDDADDHVFAFFRKIDGLDVKSAVAGRFTDLRNGAVDAEIRTLREELEQEIRDDLSSLNDEHCFTYVCRWLGREKSPISTKHIPKLCDDVETALKTLITRELAAMSGDELDQEVERHTTFARERTKLFLGRGAECDSVKVDVRQRLVSGKDTFAAGRLPIIVHGSGGVGKSSFMAKALQELDSDYPNAILVRRFIGGSPRSVSLYEFIADLLRDLARRFGRQESIPEGGLKELIDELPNRLAWATTDKPLIMGIDALDQFTPSFEARYHLWLPKALPPHVALVVSVLDGEAKEAAVQRYQNASVITLTGFDANEGGRLLDALLDQGEDIAPERKRKLTRQQRTTVLERFKYDGRPLYLILAASIVRRWPSWHPAEQLPNSLEGLVGYIVQSLYVTHGDRIAARSLDYLTASRFGVSDEEIRDLLWDDADARIQFEARRNKGQPKPEALPPVIWSRIYFEIAPYLTTSGIDGALLHRFFHRVIGEEAARISLADDRAKVHSRIAQYFSAQSLHVGEEKNRSPNLRKLMEEPWQWIQAGKLSQAEALLTSFDFAMAKCEANRFDDLRDDYQRITDAILNSGRKLSRNLTIWEEFISTRAHILRRGNDSWPSHKILLQLAIEHARTSPLAIQAKSFLAHAPEFGPIAVRRDIPAKVTNSPLLLDFVGHTGAIFGAQFLTESRIISWGADGTIRVWNSKTGSQISCINASEFPVTHIVVLGETVFGVAENGCYAPGTRTLGVGIEVFEVSLERAECIRKGNFGDSSDPSDLDGLELLVLGNQSICLLTKKRSALFLWQFSESTDDITLMEVGELDGVLERFHVEHAQGAIAWTDGSTVGYFDANHAESQTGRLPVRGTIADVRIVGRRLILLTKNGTVFSSVIGKGYLQRFSRLGSIGNQLDGKEILLSNDTTVAIKVGTRKSPFKTYLLAFCLERGKVGNTLDIGYSEPIAVQACSLYFTGDRKFTLKNGEILEGKWGHIATPLISDGGVTAVLASSKIVSVVGSDGETNDLEMKDPGYSPTFRRVRNAHPSIAFVADVRGEHVLTFDSSGFLRLWNLAEAEEVRPGNLDHLKINHSNPPHLWTVSPSGKLVATCSARPQGPSGRFQLLVWNISKQLLEKAICDTGRPLTRYHFCWTPNDQLVAIHPDKYGFARFNFASGAIEDISVHEKSFVVRGCISIGDGGLLASWAHSDSKSEVTIFDVRTLKATCRWTCEGEISCVSVDADGSLLVQLDGNYRQERKVWRLRIGEPGQIKANRTQNAGSDQPRGDEKPQILHSNFVEFIAGDRLVRWHNAEDAYPLVRAEASAMVALSTGPVVFVGLHKPS